MERSVRSTQNESVQVVVRCRPMSQKELDSGCTTVVTVFPSRGVIEVQNPSAKTENERTKMFTYDAVYDWSSTQQNIYDETVRPLVASVLEGYNGCVFAYGQTGTGKTYTMEGIVGDQEEQGIIPRAFEQIWAHINRTTGVEFLVYARYLEIYMEDIRDLLKSKNTKPLELREMAGKGVFVSHLHSQTCQSAADMMKAMKIGNRNRTTGVTNMNEHSSRSHAIFQIAIEMAENKSKSVKVGKLNLIDLAGSERQSKTGATGDRLKEASKINKALSSLGNVIYALAENSPHIPYRDSKLTRLLQDSLGGNSKTIMIANIGPASMNYDETIVTLRYAYRAKSIKNQPIKNEDIKDAKLLELQREIERLKLLIAEKGEGKALLDGTTSDATDEEDESNSDDEEERERKKMLEAGKLEVDELSKKLRTLEKQMVHGGKNIVDSVNENEIKLEQQRAEIAARKKREIEMQQQIELEEETCMELKQVFANLQQQVEFKRDKLKRLYNKLQSMRQEIKDNHEEYLKERQELVEANDDVSLQLRKSLMILENFVPPEERSRLIGLIQFDENSDNWVLKREKRWLKPGDRPVARNYRRPISEYAIKKSSEPGFRYRSENVLDLKLDMPLRTTQDYMRPVICPQVKAAVKNVIRHDTENNRIVIKLSPHGFAMRGVSRSELEGRFNKAARNTVEVHNNSIGRKPVFLLTLLALLIGKLSSTFTSKNFPLFLAAVVVGSLTSTAVFTSPLIVAMEISKGDDRAYIAMLQCVAWTVGLSLMPFIMWSVGNWVYFVIITTLPCALFLFLYKRYMIESPRWLLNQGKISKCIKELEKIAAVNNTKLPEDVIIMLGSETKKAEKVYGVMSLFSHWRIAKNTICIVISWIITSTSYLILILNTINLGGNPFLNFFYQGLAELPAYIIGKYSCDYFGRKLTHIGAFIGTSLGCLPLILLINDPNFEWLASFLAVFLKFGIAFSYYAVNLHALEIYPTCLRQTGVALGTVSANAVGILSPFIVYLGTSIDARYPYAVLAILGVVAVFSGSLLPETLHHELPETLAEAREFGAEQKLWSLPRRPTQVQRVEI